MPKDTSKCEGPSIKSFGRLKRGTQQLTEPCTTRTKSEFSRPRTRDVPVVWLEAHILASRKGRGGLSRSSALKSCCLSARSWRPALGPAQSRQEFSCWYTTFVPCRFGLPHKIVMWSRNAKSEPRPGLQSLTLALSNARVLNQKRVVVC